MFASTLALSLALLPFSYAAIHNIQVGAEGKLVYSPEAIFAKPGDQVVFHFNPKNHTVTQSSFADPCALKDGGFTSGFKPVAADLAISERPTYTVDVKDTEPIWVYCAQAARTPNSHCGAGMVFAINCGPDDAPNSFTNFKNSALAHGAKLKAEAAATSGGGDPYSGGGGYSPPAPATAAYGTLTIPAAPTPTLVTKTITLQASVWTTTYSSYPGSPDATPAALEGKVHTIVVGGPGKLLFDPPSVAAKPRDTIVFEFRQKNHTVTQSSFEDPCRPLSANGATGFDSDFLPVAEGATEFPTWNYTVTDTAPVWAYCRQKTPASHCGAGMVFAINPAEESSGGRSFTAFQNVAKTLNGTAVSANTDDGNKDQKNGGYGDDDAAMTLSGSKFVAFMSFLVAVSAFAL